MGESGAEQLGIEPALFRGQPTTALGWGGGVTRQEGTRNRMSYRIFKDSGGADWHAWDVVPQLAERRVAERRLKRQPLTFRDRRRADRRIFAGRRAVLSVGLSGGWLCFEGPGEKRRLSPIPGDWARCPESQLEQYRQMAQPVRRSIELDRHSDDGRRVGTPDS
jgi:hypothetical protein